MASRPQIRSIRTQRQVAGFGDGGAAALDRLGSAFGTVGPALRAQQDAEQAVELSRIKAENRTLAISAENAVKANPEAALASLRAGDIGAMSPNAAAWERKAYQETYKITIGTSMANIDHTEFQTQLDGLSFKDGNPETLRNGFLKEKMKGADPLFQGAYTEQFDKLSRSQIVAWRGQQQALLSANAVETRLDQFSQSIAAGGPMSYDIMRANMADVTNLALGAKNKIAARQRVAQLVIEEFVKTGSGALLTALETKDPVTGLSIADEEPELFASANRKGVAEYQALNSPAAAAEAFSISDELSALENETGGDLAAVTHKLDRFQGTYGHASQLGPLRDRQRALEAKTTTSNAVYGAFRTSLDASTPNAYVSQKNLNSDGVKMAARSMAEDVASGLTPQQAEDRLVNAIVKYRGLGKEWNSNQTHRFMGGDVAQQEAAFSLLQRVASTDQGSGAVDAILDTPESRIKFEYVATSVRLRGTNVKEALGQFNAVEPIAGLDWRTAFSAGSKPKDMKAAVEAGSKALDKILDSDGFSPAVTAMFQRELNRSAYLSGMDPVKDQDFLVEMTANATAGAFEVGPQGRLVLRQTPLTVVGTDKVERPAAFLSAQMQKDATNALDDFSASMGGLLGEAYGIESDRTVTGNGQGYIVKFSKDGDPPTAVRMRLGETVDFDVDIPRTELGPGEATDRTQSVSRSLTVPMVIPDEGLALTPKGDVRWINDPEQPGHAVMIWGGTGLPTKAEMDIATAANVEAHIAENRRIISDTEVENIVGGLLPRGRPLPADELLELQLSGLNGALDNPDLQLDTRARLEEFRSILNGVGDEFQKQQDLEASITSFFSSPPVVGQNAEGREPAEVNEETSWMDTVKRMSAGLLAMGSISTNSAAALDTTYAVPGVAPEAYTRTLTMMDEERQSMADAEWNHRDIPSGPPDMQFFPELERALTKDEQFRQTVYDDKTGQPPKSPGVTAPGGHLTVGIGFNLDRKDAPQMLKAVGANYKAVRAGRENISFEQATALMRAVNEKHYTILRHQAPNYAPARRELSAILNLHYNWPAGARATWMRKAYKDNDGAAVLRGLHKLVDGFETRNGRPMSNGLRNRMDSIIADYIGQGTS